MGWRPEGTLRHTKEAQLSFLLGSNLEGEARQPLGDISGSDTSEFKQIFGKDSFPGDS